MFQWNWFFVKFEAEKTKQKWKLQLFELNSVSPKIFINWSRKLFALLEDQNENWSHVKILWSSKEKVWTSFCSEETSQAHMRATSGAIDHAWNIQLSKFGIGKESITFLEINSTKGYKNKYEWNGGLKIHHTTWWYRCIYNWWKTFSIPNSTNDSCKLFYRDIIDLYSET